MKNDNNAGLKNFFESFIKNTDFKKAKNITDDFAIEVKPLSLSEKLTAENVYAKALYCEEVAVKASSLSILIHAITAVGNKAEDGKLTEVSFVVEHEDKDKTAESRAVLTSYLDKMPPYLIQLMYDFYLEVVREHETKFITGEFSEDTANF